MGLVINESFPNGNPSYSTNSKTFFSFDLCPSLIHELMFSELHIPQFMILLSVCISVVLK